MEKAKYISGLIVYPNNVVTEDYLKGVPGYLLYNKETYVDLTYESEFNGLKEPKSQLIKMSKKEYIDAFFEHGTLKLGTLEYYRTIDDPEQGDNSEGSIIIIGQNSTNTAFAKIGSGFNNYVFCCYDGSPNNEVIEKFGYDDYFIIENPKEFAESIRQLIEANRVIRSQCIYKKDKVLFGKTSDHFDFNVLSEKLATLVDETQYFIKTDKYEHQQEYRFIWGLENNVSEPLIIKCPEAIQFCKRRK
jgi:hypothetical protein